MRPGYILSRYIFGCLGKGSKRGKGCVGDDENYHRHHVFDEGDNADNDHHQGIISLNAMVMLLTCHRDD